MSIASKITRLFDFVAGTRIKSADVDAELNQLVTQHNNLVDDVNAQTGTAGIANGAVTTPKLATGAVTADKLDPALVQTDINLNTHRTLSTIDHPDGSVTPAKLSFDPTEYAGITAGTGDAYTVSLSTFSLTDGALVVIKCDRDQSAAGTLNVNGLGAKALKKPNGADVVNMKTGGIYPWRYNATTENFILQGSDSSGNAAAADVLAGKTCTTDAGDVTGTMADREGDNAATSSSVTGTTLKLVAPTGFYDGGDTVTITDADFAAANIKKGINLHGIIGTWEDPVLSVGSYDTAVALTERATSQGFPFVELKKFTIPYSGRVNVRYSWKYTRVSQDGVFRITKNGTTVASVSRTATYSIYNGYDFALDVSAGDVIAISCAVSIDNAGTCYVKDAKIQTSLQTFTVNID